MLPSTCVALPFHPGLTQFSRLGVAGGWEFASLAGYGGPRTQGPPIMVALPRSTALQRAWELRSGLGLRGKPDKLGPALEL